MRELIRWPASLGLGVALAIALAVSVSQIASQNPATQPEANPDALVLVDFQKRIDQYREMHKDAEKGSAKQEETSDPAKIRQAQLNLAERLRAARKDARPGDI